MFRFNKVCKNSDWEFYFAFMFLFPHRKLIFWGENADNQCLISINPQAEWVETTFPMCILMYEHTVTATLELSLYSILASTIVWGGLQCQNIYQSRPRALTDKPDCRLSETIECLWLTNAHRFTVCSAQLYQVGALLAAATSIKLVELIVDALEKSKQDI